MGFGPCGFDSHLRHLSDAPGFGRVLILYWNVPFYFGGTSLLIIVVVVMDFMAQVQSHMMSHQYEGLMKKANLQNFKR